MGVSTLRDRVRQITERSPDNGRKYYSLTLLAGAAGGPSWSSYSHWTGWADVERRIELRAASLVHADNMVKLWQESGVSCVIVHSVEDMQLFFLLGGNALVDQAVAEMTVPEVLAPWPVVQTGPSGFQHIGSLPKSAFNRAPTPTERMRVLKRDDFRCRVCGRRSADYVDVELHVHYIRPWMEGGLTYEANLITLCHTCHNGLDPHFEWGLFDLIAPGGKAIDGERWKGEHWEGVRRYRQGVLKVWSAPETVGSRRTERLTSASRRRPPGGRA